VSLGRYGRILRAPGAPHAFGGLTFSRIALGGTGLMTLLFIRHIKGSYGAAGAVIAAYTVATGVMQPIYGRFADRRGQTIVILGPLPVYVAGMVGLIAAALAGAPTGVLVVLAAVGGAGVPPVSALIRPLFDDLIGSDPDALAGAYALDAILIEVGFITGPLVGSLVIALFSTAAALATMIGFVIVGALVFSSAPASRRWRSAPHEGKRSSPLRAPGMRTLIAAASTVGVMFGSFEIGLTAFATAHGASHEVGILFALTSLASAAGGLAFGARSTGERELLVDYLTLLVAIPTAFALMLLANSMVVMGAFGILAGATIAPLVAAQNQLVPTAAPAGALTEAYTWMTLAISAGVAFGAAAAGALVDATTWRAALICGCVVTASGGALTVARRATLSTATA
jgi:MFS family permease